MSKLRVFRTCLAGLLVVACASAAWAEFRAGMSAYQKKDYPTALREFKSAGNVAPAQYNLGVMYYKGEGVKVDKKEAARLLRLAANQGHDRAQFLLGALLFTGDGVAPDIPQAVKLIKKSATKGFAEAQFRLGMMYINGDNVDKNKAEGIKWLKKSSKQGHKNAEKLLKVMGES